MALLISHLSLLPSSSSSHSPSIPVAAASATLSSKLSRKSFNLRFGSSHGPRIPCPTYDISGKRSVIVRASSEIDGKDEKKPDPLPPSQVSEEEANMPVENLPLESKMKERMEQKLRMKLAKKIRLRRKRLLRKRKMRKKGRWPPSKMKKLKNV
ncbi:uncharacterized protein A4U43_C02F14440 [Asparagus officinalis]|uniref:50S ribosomal protein 5, chloroplastic n=1 Tax=Asparagus officinalis TaxID=4686 RepID=A0A5P1FIF1_ASPOF|nr:50S ribosomal protein 5 alpha, chloroplastic [Asparagus officinalis]ONK78108.1 uncharacterized protein A4U43_C02F14440 [Asparagus officinalis]